MITAALLATACVHPPSIDAGQDDAGKLDAGGQDAGQTFDSGVDAGAVDGGASDGGAPDAGSHADGISDAGLADAGGVDAGSVDGGCLELVINLPTGRGPASVVAWDVTGDGRPDLIVANATDSTLSLFAAAGPRSYTLLDVRPTGSQPVAVAAGADQFGARVVTADHLSNSLSSFSPSDAGLGPPTSFPVGAAPSAVFVGDVFGGGLIEFVSADTGSNSLHIWLQGNGGPSVGPAGPEPHGVVGADFNGDGRVDLVFASFASGSDQVSVSFGTGGGTYARPVAFPGGGLRPSAVVSADLDGDGLADLATCDYETGTVTVRTNLDAGAEVKVLQTHLVNPFGLAVGDLDRNGRPDLVVANTGANALLQLFFELDGGYTPLARPVGRTPSSVTVVDLDGDGVLDLATTNFGDDSLTVVFRGCGR